MTPKPHTRNRRIRARKTSNYAATDLLAYIHEGETLNTPILVERCAPDWTAEAVKGAISRLLKIGALTSLGLQLCDSGQRVRVFVRNRDVADEAETSSELRRYADSGASLPIVQLMFPVPPAFRVKATRQIRPLSTTQEDAA